MEIKFLLLDFSFCFHTCLFVLQLFLKILVWRDRRSLGTCGDIGGNIHRSVTIFCMHGDASRCRLTVAIDTNRALAFIGCRRAFPIDTNRIVPRVTFHIDVGFCKNWSNQEGAQNKCRKRKTNDLSHNSEVVAL